MAGLNAPRVASRMPWSALGRGGLSRDAGGLRSKPVTTAAHRLNMTVMSRRHKRLTKSSDVDIHGAFFYKDMVAPDMIKKLVTAVNTLGVSHKVMKKAKFGGPKLKGASVTAYTMGQGIKL
jgi:hypothetical protein